MIWTRYCSCSLRERIVNRAKPTHCYRCSIEIDPADRPDLESNISVGSD